MKRQDPFDLNLNLLAYLEALIDERQVSRAAQKVNLSQPAIDLALKRLRLLFDDPLLVHTPKGLVPTQRAQELMRPVREILDQSRALILAPPAFEPATATDSFVIAATNFVASMFVPPLIRRLVRDAPQAELIVRAAMPYRVKEWFDDSTIDLGISYVVTQPGELHRRKMLQDRLVCIARPGHPVIAGELTLASLCGTPAVTVKPSTRPFDGMLDRALSAAGQSMQIVLAVSDYLLVPEVVSTTDLIAVVPERAATRFAKEYPLRVLPLPLDLPAIELSMVWHERTHREASREWLRNAIIEIFTEGTE